MSPHSHRITDFSIESILGSKGTRALAVTVIVHGVTFLYTQVPKTSLHRTVPRRKVLGQCTTPLRRKYLHEYNNRRNVKTVG